MAPDANDIPSVTDHRRRRRLSRPLVVVGRGVLHAEESFVVRASSLPLQWCWLVGLGLFLTGRLARLGLDLGLVVETRRDTTWRVRISPPTNDESR